MLWAPRDPEKACPTPHLRLCPAELEDNRDPLPTPPYVKSVGLGVVFGLKTSHVYFLGKET